MMARPILLRPPTFVSSWSRVQLAFQLDSVCSRVIVALVDLSTFPPPPNSIWWLWCFEIAANHRSTRFSINQSIGNRKTCHLAPLGRSQPRQKILFVFESVTSILPIFSLLLVLIFFMISLLTRSWWWIESSVSLDSSCLDGYVSLCCLWPLVPCVSLSWHVFIYSNSSWSFSTFFSCLIRTSWKCVFGFSVW